MKTSPTLAEIITCSLMLVQTVLPRYLTLQDRDAHGSNEVCTFGVFFQQPLDGATWVSNPDFHKPKNPENVGRKQNDGNKNNRSSRIFRSRINVMLFVDVIYSFSALTLLVRFRSGKIYKILHQPSMKYLLQKIGPNVEHSLYK